MAQTSSLSVVEIINDIQSETAQQMFNVVRCRSEPPRLAMIPDLDEYILKWSTSVPSSQSSLKRGDIIEIQGSAASGKTQLLYHLVATCILPFEMIVSLDDRSERRISVGGWQKSVVVFDCDGRWDVRRLHSILVSRLDRVLSLASHKSDLIDTSIALESLSRLHLFRPASSLQLAATLLNLPQYHKEQMPHEEIWMLMVDSISSFYWADRWQTETSGSGKSPGVNPLASVIRSIQAFRESHSPVTILTNWGLNPLSSPEPSILSSLPVHFFKQHLASPFPSPFDDSQRRVPLNNSTFSLTYHITISLAFIPSLQADLKYPDESGLQEALCDERRKEFIKRGVRAYVRNPRQECPQDSVFGSFKFRVLERDVVAASA